MKYFTVYKTATGIIETVVTSDCDLSEVTVGSDETVVEGYYSPSAIKFVDGSPVDIVFDFWDDVRSQRDALLKDCDWTQMPDSPLSNSKKTEWSTYRQQLRDLPSTYSSATSIDDVVFPTEPS